MILLKKILAVYRIIRPLNFIITLLSIIVAYVISKKGEDFSLVILLAAFSGALAGAAGNVINDYYDIETDKINKPERVLPSGDLTDKGTLFLYMIMVLLSLDLALWAGWQSFLIVFISTGIIFFYSYKLKRVPLLGNIVVSFMTGMAFIYGAIVAGNIMGGIIPAAFAFLINFIREIVKDIEDIEGDEKAGIRTFPIIRGVKPAIRIVFITVSTLIILTLAPFIFEIYKIEYVVLIMLVVNPLLVVIIKLLIDSKSKENIKRVSSLLKLAMVSGLVAIYLGV
ncbi:MAG: geranylgeranylglycerol-phosphate geranylgeranyltransferase [Ignavibacteriaceae bacterium]